MRSVITVKKASETYDKKVMKLTDIGPLRLQAQHMVGDLFNSPEDVVKHSLAMQAQDYTGGLWSVGLRTKNATTMDVEKSIAEHKLVRTWPMRGTLHFLYVDDVRWMVNLLAPRVTASVRNRRITQLGLTDEIVDEAERVMRAELKGGKSILRGDVVTLLADGVKGIAIDNQHTQHLMRNFGERGIICFGPRAGKQPTFVLLDDWVPEAADKPRPDALKELARRYFTSHGPATLKDFAGWGMLTMGDAKFGLEAAKSELREEIIDGAAYYLAPGLTAAPSRTLLLPGFDEYLLGYKNRDAVLEKLHANKVVPGGNGMFLATIVVDGQVIGLWKRRINKSGIIFEYDYFIEGDTTDTTSAESRYESFMLG